MERMQYTEQQLSEFKAEFAKRRQRQRLVMIPILVLFVLIIALQDQPDVSLFGLSAQSLMVAAFVVIFGVAGFNSWNWRCPACNRHLGRGTNLAFCPKCGAPLR